MTPPPQEAILTVEWQSCSDLRWSRVWVDWNEQRGRDEGVEVWGEAHWGGRAPVRDKFVLILQVKNAWFCAFLLWRSTCGQKPEPGGINRPLGGWRCNMHGGWKFSRGFNSHPEMVVHAIFPCCHVIKFQHSLAFLCCQRMTELFHRRRLYGAQVTRAPNIFAMGLIRPSAPLNNLRVKLR